MIIAQTSDQSEWIPVAGWDVQTGMKSERDEFKHKYISDQFQFWTKDTYTKAGFWRKCKGRWKDF